MLIAKTVEHDHQIYIEIYHCPLSGETAAPQKLVGSFLAKQGKRKIILASIANNSSIRTVASMMRSDLVPGEIPQDIAN